MYRNLTPLLIILFFLNFFHCFQHPNILVTRYREEYINKAEQLQKLNADLCEKAENDITIRLKICRRIFKLLRDDPENENPFRQSLYMNYEAFNERSNPVCHRIHVRVDQYMITDRICMPCYGRQAVDSRDNPNLKAICISYGSKNSVVVFKCLDLPVCKLQEWYKEDDGSVETSYLQPPEDLNFIRSIPIPKTADRLKLKSEFQNKYHLSFNDHPIRHLEAEYLDVLCDVMLRRAEFEVKFRRTKANTIKQRKHKYFSEYDVTIVDPFVPITLSHKRLPISTENTVNVLGYPCERYGSKGMWHRTFKIMAGPDSTSVILIEPKICNGKPCLIPLELVENVSKEYLLSIEKYF